MNIIKAVAAIVLRDMRKEAKTLGSVTYMYGLKLFTIYKNNGKYIYIVENKTVSEADFQIELELQTARIIQHF